MAARKTKLEPLFRKRGPLPEVTESEDDIESAGESEFVEDPDALQDFWSYLADASMGALEIVKYGLAVTAILCILCCGLMTMAWMLKCALLWYLRILETIDNYLLPNNNSTIVGLISDVYTKAISKAPSLLQDATNKAGRTISAASEAARESIVSLSDADSIHCAFSSAG